MISKEESKIVKSTIINKIEQLAYIKDEISVYKNSKNKRQRQSSLIEYNKIVENLHPSTQVKQRESKIQQK
jgi:hypothetical protein